MVNDPRFAPLAEKRLVRATPIAPQPITLAVLREDSQRYRLTYKLTTYLDLWILSELGNIWMTVSVLTAQCKLVYRYSGGDRLAFEQCDDR